MPRIPLNLDALAAFCRRHHIRRLSVFGSVLRDDFGPGSDVDFLYVFEDGHAPGWEIAVIEDELAAIVGRKVDLVSQRHLNPWMAQRILSEARVIYDAGVIQAA